MLQSRRHIILPFLLSCLLMLGMAALAVAQEPSADKLAGPGHRRGSFLTTEAPESLISYVSMVEKAR